MASSRDKGAPRAENVALDDADFGFRSRSRSATIRGQRGRAADLLDELPGLRSWVASLRPALYARARRAAADETGLAETAFAEACPFTATELLAADFLPR